MTPIDPQMIAIQPINNLSDIPTEIWVAMCVQLSLTVLTFWLAWKLISKLSAFVVKLVHGPKADAATTSEGGAQ